MAWRCVRNLLQPVPRHRRAAALADAPVIAQSRTALWTDGRPEEWGLVAGKVHNLRLACRCFDGVVVPAGATLSFWRQLGRPGRSRGFVNGREVRQGCVVPTVAGGLCQLSNALARCAIEAGLEVVERHRHTRRVEGQPATADDHDATVFWNYVDLRLRAPADWRIEAELSADALTLRLRSTARPAGARQAAGMRIALRPAQAAPPPVARGCLSCNETACFRHGHGDPATGPRTAVLVDELSPEFAAYLATHADAATWMLPWPLRRTAPAWAAPASAHRVVARAATLWRTVLTRWHLWRPGATTGQRQAAVLAGRRVLAAAYARRLRPEHQRLIVEQGLLGPLHALGALGGRQVEVLARELPMAEVQARLDAAHRQSPHADTLVDFRADASALANEAAGLRQAMHLVTAHAEVATLAQRVGPGLRVTLLPWHLPPAAPARPTRPVPARPTVVFPAAAWARKGADDLAAVLRELGWPLMVPGRAAALAPVWHGLPVRQASDWLLLADLVVLPAYVEHAPREVLQALACGLPAVVSTGCGLAGLPGVVEVPAGDRAALKQALRSLAAPG